MKHLIGNNSSYDADMTIIESFVRQKNNPGNPIAEAAVFNYYISQIYNYMEKAKEIIPTIKTEDEFENRAIYKGWKGAKKDKISLEENRNYIISNWNFYQDKILKLVEDARQIFITTGKTPINNINNIFLIISGLLCLQTEDIFYKENFLSLPSYYKEYAYPNNTGLFGFNTYLYGFFSGVLLIGVPLNIAEFDNFIGCPATFMTHDHTHNDIYSRFSNINILKEKYYGILSNNDYQDVPGSPASGSSKIKELLIFVLWVIIHEISHNVFELKHYHEYFRIIDMNHEEFPSLQDEFKRFSDITNTDDVRNLLLNIYPDFEYIDHDYYNYYSVMLYGFYLLTV